MKQIGDMPKLGQIGESTLSGCTALERVGNLNSVTSIGEGAFLGCTKLECIAAQTDSDLIFIYPYFLKFSHR